MISTACKGTSGYLDQSHSMVTPLQTLGNWFTGGKKTHKQSTHPKNPKRMSASGYTHTYELDKSRGGPVSISTQLQTTSTILTVAADRTHIMSTSTRSSTIPMVPTREGTNPSTQPMTVRRDQGNIKHSIECTIEGIRGSHMLTRSAGLLYLPVRIPLYRWQAYNPVRKRVPYTVGGKVSLMVRLPPNPIHPSLLAFHRW
jgi:hypothetical protein